MPYKNTLPSTSGDVLATKKLGAHHNSPSLIFRVFGRHKSEAPSAERLYPQSREFVNSENERAVADNLPCHFTSKGDQ